MWNTIQTLLYDASIEHSGEFCDFVEFCFRDHESYIERVTWEYEEQSRWYEDRLYHVQSILGELSMTTAFTRR